MDVLVDTNVISDIFHDDPVWRSWAEIKIEAHMGRLFINPFIYSELCCRTQSAAELDISLSMLGVKYVEISKEALFIAAQAFLVYRARGGKKISPLPDFFIGAHAQAQGWPLLTRDVARYQTYFPKVTLIHP